MKRTLAIALCLLFALSAFAGCSSAPAAETAASARSDDALYAPDGTVKMGFITSRYAHTVPMAWSKGIKQYLDSFANVEYKDFDGEGTAETQLKLMEDLINQEYDVIFLQANDGAALADAVRQAEEKGIYVICLNLDVTTVHAGLVTMSDYSAGATIADKMAEELGGKGNIVVLESPPGATLGVNRKQGFLDRIAEKYPEMKVVASQDANWMKDEAFDIMNTFLQQFDKIDGVYGINDSMAQGAALAAQAAGRLGEMVIWGADGDGEAMQYIEDGIQTGTVYTDCYDQGATAARLAMWLVDSKIDTSSYQYTARIEMTPVLVTSENVASIPPEARY